MEYKEENGMLIVCPDTYNDMTEIIQLMGYHKPIEIRLSGMDLGEAQRLVDGICGAAIYADWRVQKKPENIFLLYPDELLCF